MPSHSIGRILLAPPLCYAAHTSDDVVMPGGDIGTTLFDYDVVDTSPGWTSHVDEEIVVGDSPTGFFTVGVAGEITSTEAVFLVVRYYDDAHVFLFSDSFGPIGPGSNVPFTFTTAELSTSDVGYVDFALSDPDGGGGILHAGATVELCAVPAPG